MQQKKAGRVLAVPIGDFDGCPMVDGCHHVGSMWPRWNFGVQSLASSGEGSGMRKSWAPTIVIKCNKWSYNHCKCRGFFTLLTGVITPFKTIVGAHCPVDVDCLSARPLPPDFIVTMRIEPQVKSRAQRHSQIFGEFYRQITPKKLRRL